MRQKLFYWPFFIAMFLLLGIVFMFLWNALLPQMLSVTKINYWQALGLMLLCRILFGRFNFGDSRGEKRDDDQRHLLKDKLMTMDEADKSAFKEEWRKRCERRGKKS